VDDRAWLAGLKAGDKVVVDNWCRTVDSVTATLIRVGGSNFNRKTGRRCGRDRFDRLQPWTQEWQDEHDAEWRQRRLSNALYDVRWRDCDLATLEAVAALVLKPAKEPTP